MNLTTELRRFTRGSDRSRGLFDRHHRGPRLTALARTRRGRTPTHPLARLKGLAGRLRRTRR
ncbi:hypothetical protein ABGB12_04735 [Actinocorallia sp. B10E7]|uniref:hypothetical protein n=1 Tax=Actinocorallia sp. B10E7 TaxID=3153558 RepID=UPI00325D78C4